MSKKLEPRAYVLSIRPVYDSGPIICQLVLKPMDDEQEMVFDFDAQKLKHLFKEVIKVI